MEFLRICFNIIQYLAPIFSDIIAEMVECCMKGENCKCQRRKMSFLTFNI